MSAINLGNEIHWVGSRDPNLRIFDIIMNTEYGSTYNSYLVRGRDRTALIDTVKYKFSKEYIDNIESLVGVANIDYLVVSHTEPDHAGCIEDLLRLNPSIKILCSSAAQKYLRPIVNMDFESIVVKDGDRIDLGSKTLEFITAPLLHWPDSIYTYIPETKSLVTCDSFGAHFCSDGMLLSGIKGEDRDHYEASLKYYFDMIMGPFKKHMTSAIDKLFGKEVSIILPGHGPILDENPMDIVEKTKRWASVLTPNINKTVVIPYVSAYGYTEAMANEIKRGIESVGVDVRMFNMVYSDYWQVLEELQYADGMLFGSPTINSEALPPIWNLLTGMSPVVHGRKLASAFGSYGWSGEAVPNLMARLKQLRAKLSPSLKVAFKPSATELQECFEYGVEFGNIVLGKAEPRPVE